MMKKLIYIAGGNVSVLESQVLELLKFYHIKGIPLALIMGYRNTNEKGEIEKKLSNYSFLDKSYPTYQIFEFLTIRNIFSAVKKVKDWENSFFHVRSEHLGYLIKKMVIDQRLNNRILIDIRGVVYREIEFKYMRCSGIRKLLLKVQANYYQFFYKRLFDSRIVSQIVISSVSPQYCRKSDGILCFL